MSVDNTATDALRAGLTMTAAAAVFLGALGFLGFYLTDKAFHGESTSLSAGATSSKEGKAAVKKPSREPKPN